MFPLYMNIKARRKELSMTQTELAKRVGYADKTMISRIENGKIDLYVSQLLEFAKALQTTPMRLLGLSDDESISDIEYDYVNKYREIDTISQSNVKMMIDNAYNLKNLKEEGRLMDSESSGKAKDDNSSVGGIA